jgi:hypothetical protein
MITHSKTLVALVAVIFLMSFGGCKKEEDSQANTDSTDTTQTQPISEGDNQTVADDTSISDLVSLWDSGKKDEATENFLAIDWQDAATFKQIRGLSMSEDDMKSLSEDEIKSIVGETMPLLGSMRKLFFHIAAEAERLATSENMSKAKEYLTAVKEYGSSLSESNHLYIVQKHGEAAVLYAEGKLSDIK